MDLRNLPLSYNIEDRRRDPAPWQQTAVRDRRQAAIEAQAAGVDLAYPPQQWSVPMPKQYHPQQQFSPDHHLQQLIQGLFGTQGGF